MGDRVEVRRDGVDRRRGTRLTSNMRISDNRGTDFLVSGFFAFLSSSTEQSQNVVSFLSYVHALAKCFTALLGCGEFAPPFNARPLISLFVARAMPNSMNRNGSLRLCNCTCCGAVGKYRSGCECKDGGRSHPYLNRWAVGPTFKAWRELRSGREVTETPTTTTTVTTMVTTTTTTTTTTTNTASHQASR